jgi:predicted transcriptional regulator
MPRAPEGKETEDARIVLGLLESVERGGAQSQRLLAAELGIALGLVNAYLKRCIRKGLVKVTTAPTRRYAYYLTPQGFTEKSRLTVEYLSYSFSFFRRAKADCSAVFKTAQSRGLTRLALAGVSDLAEIATICALESGVQVVAVIDAGSAPSFFVGIPVVASFAAVKGRTDGVVVTDLHTAAETYAVALEQYDADHVLVPSLLRVRIADRQEAVA